MKNRISYQPSFFRGLILVVDFSEYLSVKDYTYIPTKLDFLKNYLLDFAKKYFEHNTITTLSLIGISDYIAKSIIPIVYDEINFKSALNENWPKAGSGYLSFYNGLYVR